MNISIQHYTRILARELRQEILKYTRTVEDMIVYSQKIEENLQANENKRIQVGCWTADHYIKNQ